MSGFCDANAHMKRTHLPDLGRRGEGWVVLQVLLSVAIIATGFVGLAWVGPARVAGAIAGLALIAFGVGLVTAGILGLRRQLTAYPRPVPPVMRPTGCAPVD